MTLCSAMRQAIASDGYVTAPEFFGQVKIHPGSGPECCVLMRWDGSNRSKSGWTPTSHDFLRDDWIVVH